MLFVCRESYEIASSLYTRAFSHRGESFPETFFNFEDDILFMDARVSWFKNILKDMDEDISKVSNLALRVEFSSSEKLQGCPNEQTNCRCSFHLQQNQESNLGSRAGNAPLPLSLPLLR